MVKLIISKKAKVVLKELAEVTLNAMIEQGVPPGEQEKYDGMIDATERLIKDLEVSLETDDMELDRHQAAVYETIEMLLTKFQEEQSSATVH